MKEWECAWIAAQLHIEWWHQSNADRNNSGVNWKENDEMNEWMNEWKCRNGNANWNGCGAANQQIAETHPLSSVPCPCPSLANLTFSLYFPLYFSPLLLHFISRLSESEKRSKRETTQQYNMAGREKDRQRGWLHGPFFPLFSFPSLPFSFPIPISCFTFSILSTRPVCGENTDTYKWRRNDKTETLTMTMTNLIGEVIDFSAAVVDVDGVGSFCSGLHVDGFSLLVPVLFVWPALQCWENWNLFFF